jgi:HAMP domain-containing protein
MGLRLKFNLILLAIFLAGFATVGVVAQRYLHTQATEDAKRAAHLVLDATTLGNLDPRVAAGLGSRLVELKLREFDTTSAQSGLETEVLNRIKSNSAGTLVETIRTTNRDDVLVVARVVRGAGDGFRMRMVSIDIANVTATAKIALTTLMSSLGAVFFAVFFALNLMLDRMIVRPVAEMAKQADAVSIGDFSIPQFVPASADEIGTLGIAFNRMRRSTEEAIALLKTAKF